MHATVKLDVAKILEKAGQYRLPKSWEHTVELLSGEKECIEVDLAKGSPEW